SELASLKKSELASLKKSELASPKKLKKSRDSLKKLEGEAGAAKSRLVDLLKSYDEKTRAFWHDVAPSFEKYLDTPKKDFSEVVLKNTLSGDTITLIKDTPIPDPNSVGVFFDIINNEHIRRKKGEEFTLKPDEKTKFKLIDISSTEAKIQDVATGTTSTLSKSSSPAP
ncbi:hypothetical protein EBU02_13950, partial [bacterium]|nr:hypothetical protein [bacterium]